MTVNPAKHEADPVLRAEDLNITRSQPAAVKITGVNLGLSPGQFVHVTCREAEGEVLLDMLQGLEPPDAGRVRVDGIPWTSMGADEESACRRRMRRVFPGTAWLSNLDMDENILLAARYGGAGSDEALRDEAARLCAGLGLPSLPDSRPAWTPLDVQVVCQWVRLLLGEGTVFLIHPPPGAGREDEQPPGLWEMLEERRARGAAILWCSEHAFAATSHSRGPDLRYTIHDGQWREVHESDQ